jgi:hypothetical protein
MKTTLFLPALLTIFVARCRKHPDPVELSDKLVVLTNYNSKANFSGYTTFVLPPYVGLISQFSTDSILDPRFGDQVLTAIRTQLTGRGYTEVPGNQQADLGIVTEVLKDVPMSSSWYPGSWWGYAGWGGCYWRFCGMYPIYPASFPVYVYNSGALIIELVDLKNIPQQNNRLNVIWTNWNGGAPVTIGPNMENTLGAIDQAFLQSPYLKTQ